MEHLLNNNKIVPHHFQKIKAGKNAQATDEFMIIARIESLILNKGIKDALQRAKKYINAGADGIMIHSRKKNPSEIFEFCKFYNKFKNRKPLVIVPSSFSQVTEEKAFKSWSKYCNIRKSSFEKCISKYG